MNSNTTPFQEFDTPVRSSRWWVATVLASGLALLGPGCDQGSGGEGSGACSVDVQEVEYDFELQTLVGCEGVYECGDDVLEMQCAGNPADGFSCRCLQNGSESATFQSTDICTTAYEGKYASFDVRRDQGCGWGQLELE